MTLRVNTNIPAINSHRNLILNNTNQARTMERLSSGLKINRGADGPASLVISERLRSQTAGLKQAIDNSEAGVSLVQTAEAALNEVSSALINARQLAVASANEAVNDEFMLRANQQEIDNILATVNRIAKNTQLVRRTCLTAARERRVLFLVPTLSLSEPVRQPRVQALMVMMFTLPKQPVVHR